MTRRKRGEEAPTVEIPHQTLEELATEWLTRLKEGGVATDDTLSPPTTPAGKRHGTARVLPQERPRKPVTGPGVYSVTTPRRGRK